MPAHSGVELLTSLLIRLRLPCSSQKRFQYIRQKEKPFDDRISGTCPHPNPFYLFSHQNHQTFRRLDVIYIRIDALECNTCGAGCAQLENCLLCRRSPQLCCKSPAPSHLTSPGPNILASGCKTAFLTAFRVYFDGHEAALLLKMFNFSPQVVLLPAQAPQQARPFHPFPECFPSVCILEKCKNTIGGFQESKTRQKNNKKNKNKK
jgi:hypothetical protein